MNAPTKTPGRVTRRRWLLATTAAAAAAALPGRALASRPEMPLVEMWKSPTCGCCGAWARHLEANGFRVQTQVTDNPAAMRAKVGFDPRLGSCHAAMVGGYALEGHVPAREIHRL